MTKQISQIKPLLQNGFLLNAFFGKNIQNMKKCIQNFNMKQTNINDSLNIIYTKANINRTTLVLGCRDCLCGSLQEHFKYALFENKVIMKNRIYKEVFLLRLFIHYHKNGVFRKNEKITQRCLQLVCRKRFLQIVQCDYHDMCSSCLFYATGRPMKPHPECVR